MDSIAQKTKKASIRWKHAWAMAQSIYSNLSPQDRLYKALDSFLMGEIKLHEDEIELYEGENNWKMLTILALTGVRDSNTHSKEAIDKAIKRLFKKPKGGIFQTINTPVKRIALLLSPFFLIITVFRLGKDLDHYSWEPSFSFLLFGFLAIASVAIAFFGLGDWIKGGKQ